jgi:UDP-2,3-diacylglucosamine hydrolase
LKKPSRSKRLLNHLQASDTWGHILLVSDLHLSANDPPTAAAWHQQIQDDRADAVIVLGDYFDLWVGDDLLRAQSLAPPDQADVAFWQMCAAQLRALTQRKPVYWMVGNRDFLVGEDFALATGVALLADPCCLDWGHHRWLFSHGDQWCTDDPEYQRFRDTVRSTSWQQGFLSQPLSERLRQGRQMRAQSQAHQQQRARFADVNAELVFASMAQANATGVIHGHTHQGRSFPLAHTQRHVLSDWDASAHPPRLKGLRLSADGIIDASV